MPPRKRNERRNQLAEQQEMKGMPKGVVFEGERVHALRGSLSASDIRLAETHKAHTKVRFFGEATIEGVDHKLDKNGRLVRREKLVPIGAIKVEPI